MTNSQPSATAQAPAFTQEQFTEVLGNYTKAEHDYVFTLVNIYDTPEQRQAARNTYVRAVAELYGLVGLEPPAVEGEE